MARAALVAEDLEVRPARDQRAGGSGMVEMDVRERDGRGDLVAEARQQGVEAGGRARVDDDAVDEPGADDLRAAEMVEVDQADATTRSW